jgi:epoxyqueuosine reductase
MTLPDMLRMSKEAFLSATRRSALRRARYAGFLRNVAIALGNSDDLSSLDVLIETLDHPEPLVRAHVAWALGNLASPKARNPLRNRLLIEEDAEVRKEIVTALDDALGSAGHTTLRLR